MPQQRRQRRRGQTPTVFLFATPIFAFFLFRAPAAIDSVRGAIVRSYAPNVPGFDFIAGRRGVAVAAFGGNQSAQVLIYGGVGGGGGVNTYYLDLSLIDLAANTVTVLQDGTESLLNDSIPHPRIRIGGHAQWTNVGFTICQGGGWGFLSESFLGDCWKFDLATSSWTDLSNVTGVLPAVARAGTSVDETSRFFLTFGGQGSFGYSDELYRIDVMGAGAAELVVKNNNSQFPSARSGTVLVRKGASNTFLLMGGFASGGNYLRQVFQVELSGLDGWWTYVAPLTGWGASYLGIGMWDPVRNVTLFGFGSDGSSYSNNMYVSDATGANWTLFNPQGNVPLARMNVGYASVKLANGDTALFGIGGESGSFNIHWDAFLLRPGAAVSMAASSTVGSTTEENAAWIIGVVVGAVACCVFCVLAGIAVAVYLGRFRNREFESSLNSSMENQDSQSESGSVEQDDDAIEMSGSDSATSYNMDGSQSTRESVASFQSEQGTGVGAFSDRGKFLQDVIVGEKIGAGAFGDVYKGTWHGANVALKCVRDSRNDILAAKEFWAEVRALKSLKHPNVVQYFGVFKDESGNQSRDEWYIVMEYVTGGSLLAALHSAETSHSVPQCVRFCLDACSGLAYVTSCGILHRDVAARNLLLAETGSVKVADMGMSRMTADDYYKSTNRRVPVRWSSVEVLRDQRYTSAADVWAFGITMWEVFTGGIEPFLGLGNVDVMHCIVDGQAHRELSRPPKAPLAAYRLMCSCWQSNPSDRPSFTSLLLQLKKILSNVDRAVGESDDADHPLQSAVRHAHSPAVRGAYLKDSSNEKSSTASSEDESSSDSNESDSNTVSVEPDEGDEGNSSSSSPASSRSQW